MKVYLAHRLAPAKAIADPGASSFSFAVALLVVALLGVTIRAEGRVLYVSPSGLHVYPYTNWTDAATNVQAAIDAAQDGDEVRVANGVYPVTTQIILTNGVTVASVNGRDTVTIDGQSLTRVMGMDHPAALLRGITLANGKSIEFGGGGLFCNRGRVEDCVVRNSENYVAGGILCGSGGVVADSLIVSNNATGLDWDPGVAGGIWCLGGVVTNCVIEDNVANHGFGGGVALAFSGVLLDSVVAGNRAEYGGGVFCVYSSRVDRCKIVGNEAGTFAGGLWVWGSDATSSIIAENAAATGGGAFLGSSDIFASSDPDFNPDIFPDINPDWLSPTSRLLNCTVAENTAHVAAGGLMCVSNAVVLNTIIWANEAPEQPNVTTSGVDNVFRHNCSTPLLVGIGNIDTDPLLTPVYRLKAASPCNDAATDIDAPERDIDGEARWDHPDHSDVVSIVDIGADEYVDTDLDNMADHWEIEHFRCIPLHNGTGDVDGDVLSDLAEYEHGTDPNNPDTDGDGMPDGWEVRHEFDPLNPADAGLDADDDGISNWAESISDTDPRDSNSLLELLGVRPELGGMRIGWQGGLTAWQFIETSTALSTTNWNTIYGIPPPTPITNAVIHFGSSNQVLFYRIRAHR